MLTGVTVTVVGGLSAYAMLRSSTLREMEEAKRHAQAAEKLREEANARAEIQYEKHSPF